MITLLKFHYMNAFEIKIYSNMIDFNGMLTLQGLF